MGVSTKQIDAYIEAHYGKHESYTRQEIRYLLKLTITDYLLFQYDQAVDFLNTRPEGKLHQFTMLSRKAFWDWWREQWIIRDRCFLVEGIDQVDLTTRQKLYEKLHDGRALASDDNYLGRKTNQSYTHLITRINE